MSSFAEKYFGGEIAKQYGSQNARTNDMKPVRLDHHKDIFARYRDNDLSTLLNDPKALMHTIRRDNARSYSIDDLLTPAALSSKPKSDPGRYGLPQNEHPSTYGIAKASMSSDATTNGYFGKLTSQAYQDSSYAP